MPYFSCAYIVKNRRRWQVEFGERLFQTFEEKIMNAVQASAFKPGKSVALAGVLAGGSALHAAGESGTDLGRADEKGKGAVVMRQEAPGEIVRPRMLYEALADAVRERIFRHELAPGDPLDEFRLAKSFVVSRTPIREALKVLASEGVVELRAGQGCFVARLTWADVLQVFDVLELLELFAVRAATKGGAQLALGDSFQRSRGEASGNACLPRLFERLVGKLRLAFGPLFDSPEMQPSRGLWMQLRRLIAEEGDVGHALSLLAAYAESRRSVGHEFFLRAERKLQEKQEQARLEQHRKQGDSGEVFMAAVI